MRCKTSKKNPPPAACRVIKGEKNETETSRWYTRTPLYSTDSGRMWNHSDGKPTNSQAPCRGRE